MYKYTAVLLAVAAVVNAQSLPTVPSCSLQCFTTALTSDGCASLTDFSCHCAKPQLVSQIQPCVAKACSSADQATVNQVVQDTCKAAGVPITLPGSGSSSSAAASSAPASSAPTSSAPESSAAPASSSDATPSSSVEEDSSNSSTDAPTSTEASPSTTTAYTTAAASSGVAAPTGGVTANATTSVVPFTGDAAQLKGAFGGIAVVAVALAFAL
ncbi:hypothetical protein MMC16_002747 [Acarospora aff. strigata]|nr:hypothetical protein [Acarospora aff. strigata]